MNQRNLLLIGNTLDMYDILIYVSFSYYLNLLFFSKENSNFSILVTLLVLFVSYAARILGGIIFGVMSDKLGRKLSLSMSSFFLAICTFLIILIPTYQSIGIISTFIFIFFRLVQGICFGGEVSNLIVYILEHGQDKYLSSAKITASSTLGALLATGTSILMSHWFSHHDILDYAWRVPFIISLLSVCTSIYIRNQMEESQLFLQNKGQQKKIKMAIHFPTIVKITLAIASGACSFYVINASISFLSTKYDVNSIYIQLFCSTFLFILILISGLVSRKMERRGISILKLGILMLMFLSIPLFYIIAQKEIISSIVALLIFIIITSMVQANIPLLALSLTKFSGRSLNLSVGYNLGIVLFGSSAPYFIHLFSQQNIAGIGYYVTIISLISYLAIVFALPKIRNTRHTITAKL